jgi:hypothetical protein
LAKEFRKHLADWPTTNSGDDVPTGEGDLIALQLSYRRAWRSQRSIHGGRHLSQGEKIGLPPSFPSGAT